METIRRTAVDPEGRPIFQPVRVRLGKLSQIGALSSGGKTPIEVQYAVEQIDPDHTDGTHLLIVMGWWKEPPPGVTIYRARLQRRKRGDLQLRLPNPKKVGLRHPYPLGTWQGTVALPVNEKSNQPQVLIALTGLSHRVRAVQSELYLPKRFTEGELPHIVLP